ncbi:MAG: N-acetyltransferase [Acidobacteria bacterium]|nr:N-acetyltransferase [Acidobacteriota bacterium]
MASIDVAPVQASGDAAAFLKYPYTLYRKDPHWVAPLRLDQKRLFDTARHPFYKHAEIMRFLARRNGRTVGRVAAIWDRNHNEFHHERAGFFGFYESEDEPAVARGLLEAARVWLAGRGAEFMRGPVNPSTNYECGLLVEGFDTDPFVMMPYNPPYYSRLFEGVGLRKAKDLLAYVGRPEQVQREKIARVARAAAENGRFSVRAIRMAEFWTEVERIWKVYNAAWSRNWGFVPVTREEFWFLAKEMKPLVKPELLLLGEKDGEVVAFALALPDINQALKRARGRLFPLGLLKILYYQRRIRGCRVLTLGVVENRRTAGVAAAFYLALTDAAKRLQYGDCEFSWVLEDNTLMNRSLEALGANVHKVYRIYEWT